MLGDTPLQSYPFSTLGVIMIWFRINTVMNHHRFLGRITHGHMMFAAGVRIRNDGIRESGQPASQFETHPIEPLAPTEILDGATNSPDDPATGKQGLEEYCYQILVSEIAMQDIRAFLPHD